MNINEDVLQGILADNGIYASEQEAVFKAIEIKPVDCDECANQRNYGACQNCIHNGNVDSFKPKPKPCEHDWVYGHCLTQAHRKCLMCGETQEAKFE